MYAAGTPDNKVSGTYGATFKYKGVTYNPTVTYARGDVKLVSVTVKDGISSAGKQFDTVAGEAIKLETPKVSGKYFTGWKVEGGDGQVSNTGEYTVTLAEDATAITITAQFVDIKTVHGTVRPNGDPNNFKYANTYKAAGISYNETTGMITVDQKTALEFINNGENSAAMGNITQTSGSLNGQAQ